jgi:hypothetical protein|tara:strand:+ start:415 stop:681 length:267 start_codon:yes stop_codon:yes gene_type:complete
MGRVNNTAMYDQKKVKRYGKLYGTIDFDVNESVSQEMFEKVPEKPTVGRLEIGGKKFDVTFQELDMLAETIDAAKKTVLMRYRMGMMR